MSDALEPIKAKKSRATHALDVCMWHIASFCCVAVFGRYRGIADYDNPATRQIYGFTA